MANPDYRRIYTDMLTKKYPEKKKECDSIFKKNKLSTFDIIRLNALIFNVKENPETKSFNQKHRSYNEFDILKILDYQKKNQLNNSQLAHHFDVSRNSLTKWKKLYIKTD
ncbi:helix-turn-helix domain-containing protein [Chryseobacterium aahli]|uniref:helix-turn-helix domain-containing protein n=1 Tax=Chryseobacterium aahli TaxID=1278643 RepID=UPI001F617706|nr:helix-turn-helix domain-containing protein [Chryseobacterium aahli]MCI3938584.1 helix-turn-helix domain-containing protein [Chryseobacterium aahli]